MSKKYPTLVSTVKPLRQYAIRGGRTVESDTKTCADCGTPFYRHPAKPFAVFDVRRFCSHACAVANRPRVDWWARFREYVGGETSSGCTPWLGKLIAGGYGSFWRDGKTLLAHRVAYEHARGTIPPSLEIDHLCRNRACVNPEHMEAVTGRENVLRSPIAPSAINARKTHCPRGHAYAGDNVRVAQRQRYCRACGRLRYHAKKKGLPWPPP